jgi:hypothetical protein
MTRRGLFMPVTAIIDDPVYSSAPFPWAFFCSIPGAVGAFRMPRA